MKKLYFLLFLLTTVIQAQIVNIPDTNFKSKLLLADSSNMIAKDLLGNYTKIDTNNDQQIQLSEAQSVGELDVSSSAISDLTGIAAFTNLTIFRCNNNQLTSLNISNLTGLNFLGCGFNQLASLDISTLANLYGLTCEHNQLTQLNVSAAPNLNTLICSFNPLTSLDVSNLTHLDMLFCTDSSLAELNLGNINSVTRLYLSNSQLNTLNLSHLSNLQVLEFAHNQLTSIDLNNLANLYDLRGSFNQLTTVEFGNNTNIGICELGNNAIVDLNFGTNSTVNALSLENNLIAALDFSNVTLSPSSYVVVSGNPISRLNCKNGRNDGIFVLSDILNQLSTWQYVCLDETESEEVIQNFPGIVVNSYCTFSPGGSYNTITGTVKFDAAGDGCDDNDGALPNIKMTINDGTEDGSSFLNLLGRFTFYTQTGNFTVTPGIENPSWFSFVPETATVPFFDNANNMVTQDFCLSGNGFHPDIEIVVAPIFSARPGFDSTYQIIYSNKGNYAYPEGIVSFQFDDAILDYVGASVSPFTQATGELNWLFHDLMPFESRSITVNFHVNAPTDVPAVNDGDELHFTASSFPSEVDENPQDNTFTLDQVVVNSFDPNDKTCLEGSVVSADQIGKYLHYNINFENTGTAAAEKVVVKDLIDTAKFDLGSLQVLNTSHPATTRITGNKVEFIFENINLAPAAHGNVVFKIKTKQDLPVNTTVSNQASIYFDYNFPVITNTATSTFELLANADFTQENAVAIYPNPATNRISVTAASMIKSIAIYDMQGRTLGIDVVNQTQAVIDVSRYPKGIYFFKVTTDKGLQVQRVIKE